MVLEDICNNYNVIEKDVLSISDTSQELLITLDLLLVFEMKRNAKFQYQWRLFTVCVCFGTSAVIILVIFKVDSTAVTNWDGLHVGV